ncbi:hypothetical protein CEXT_59911 [Caerostris extrusa]|uniref:Uncharacterized protein n=1 Tax=Caerostris extrusa TaxID=172846 RepID=A0AAV4RLQ7_CAEEX|nr:hypothetical protein CEXT_59911 [Caerostris extrusa]
MVIVTNDHNGLRRKSVQVVVIVTNQVQVTIKVFVANQDDGTIKFFSFTPQRSSRASRSTVRKRTLRPAPCPTGLCRAMASSNISASHRHVHLQNRSSRLLWASKFGNRHLWCSSSSGILSWIVQSEALQSG